jgi:adenylosuccinate synthase
MKRFTKIKMEKIVEVDEVEPKKIDEVEPKKIDDIMKRYMESQKELMEMLTDIFIKLNSPLLKKLLE